MSDVKKSRLSEPTGPLKKHTVPASSLILV